MKKTLLLLFFLLKSFLSFSQNPTDIKKTFGSFPGFDNYVYATVVQPDGKILVGGVFSKYKGAPESCLVRLNPDGSKDATFNIGAGIGAVYSIVLQNDGKILVGGSFTKFQGKTQNRLIRLNPDGSKDLTFDIGTGFDSFNDVVYSIALQTNGKILVGGNFLTFQGVSQKYFIQLNADGSKDTTFNLGTGPSNIVYTLALQNDGKILVGGNFAQYQGASQNRLVRLNPDGTKDLSFSVGLGFDYTAKEILIQPDGKILVAGWFTSYQGEDASNLVRINTDGSIDTTFNIKAGFNDTSVESIALQPDGKILAGGTFLYFQGFSQNHFVRLNADGSKDASLDVGTSFGYGNGNNIFSIAVQTDGKILVGGDMYAFQDIQTNHFIRLNANGSKDNSFDSGQGFDYPVCSIVTQPDGKLLISGQFSKYQETSQNCLVRLNPDQSRDNSFKIGTGFFNYWGGEPIIQAIALQTDGKIIAGGCFTAYKDVSQKGLVRLNTDGSKDASFNIGSGFDGSVGTDKVHAIVIQPDGKIIVGSDFWQYNQVRNDKIIRLNIDGSVDKTFITGGGFDYVVEAIVLQDDGKIIVGGQFTKYQGVAQNYLIRLNPDGSKDDSFNIGTGFNYPVRSLSLQKDGKLLVGGEFTSYQNKVEKYFIRLNADGSKDALFNTGTGFNSYVNSIVVQNDDKIIVGGQFTMYKGYIQNRLARLNTDGSSDNPFNAGVAPGFNDSSFINTVKLLPDGQIILGGDFTTYHNDNKSAYIIGLEGNYIATPLIAKITPTNITCSAISGDASVSVNGGKSPYTYLWSNGATTTKITGLSPGDYSCKVTDADLTTVTESFKIAAIADTEKPTITAPINVAVNISSGCTSGAVVLGNPITADNCSVVSVTNDAPAVFPLGNTTVIWTAKDTSNNTATATQIVTVNDVTLPTIKAPASIIVNTNTNCTATAVVLGNPITADNCTVISLTNNAPSVFPIGNTTVTWTVKDASNNTATATQLVTVKDMTAPTITAPLPVTVSTNLKCTAVGVVLGNAVTADNCSSVTVSNNAPSAFPLGKTTVTWTAKDSNNNTTTATQIVTVNDATLPTIKAPAAITVNANTNCTATNVVLGNPVTADNCSVASVTNNAPLAFTVGETTVTWTVKDGSNNTAIATQIVTVKGIDATIANNAGILTAVETGATYKWLECNNGTFTPILNENKVSFTPKKTGNYAIEITKNGCSVTSTCYEVKTLGTNDFNFENSLKLYPNPTKDFVTIQINTLDNALLKIFNVNGQFILSKELKTVSNTINISHLASGVYLFEVSNDNGKFTKKVIKN